MVKINGVDQEVAGMTLSVYLKTTDYDIAHIVIEQNGKIIPKLQYETTLLCNGDQVEIVCFVGGG